MRIGLPTMVLTSLSLHLIALLIWMLSPGRPGERGSLRPGPVPGPVMIISKEIAPEKPRPPVPVQTPAPPTAPAPLAPLVEHRPAALPTTPPPPDEVLAGGGGPRLHGGVVFILDISGSMYESYAGSTRLALARKFIDRQIAALPAGTPFAVTLYGETTRRSGPLVPANPATRSAAQRYLGEDFDCGGGTNLPAGLDAAEELHPDGMVIVTDGDLNIANDKLMTEARRILGRPGPQVAIFGIAPRAGTGDAELLENLARQQVGAYQAMDVPHRQ